MKTSLLALLAFAASAAFASTSPSSASAPDAATYLLQQHGAIAVAKAGPHVEAGTFRVQVAAKLGRPDETLADGSWLYHDRRVSESTAKGTLVVRFTGGRVQALSLVAPQALIALRSLPAPQAGTHFVATP